jgi:predicted O-linked N-acetylglucosamine transferase (SPINDLY family)
MSQADFLTALKSVTARTLPLAGLVAAGGRLADAGEPALAEQLYKVWIGLNADDPHVFIAQFNASGLMTAAGDLDGSIAMLEAAIAANPDFLPAYVNLGGLYERQGQVDRGVSLWAQAAARPIDPTGTNVGYVIAALKQMGRVLGENQRLAAAEQALRQCLDLRPEQRDVAEQFVAIRLSQCIWPVVQPWEGVDRATLMRGIHPLSMAAYTDDPLLQLACARSYVEQAAGERPHSPEADRRNAPIDLSGRRLKVGYISSDLRDHAVGYLMAELFETHDREKVEAFVYYCGVPPKGAIHERYLASAEHWLNIRDMSDEEAARRIAADGIDILIDVNGHTRDARLGVFARRPAPIQVNWLGFPGTMGSPYHHYIIADPFIVPEGSEIYYSEKVLRLPCYQPNDRKRVVAPQRPSRHEAGLPDDAFVFACFNGPQKFTRPTLNRWLEILRRTPGSVLWLLDCSEEAKANIVAFFHAQGVDRSRIVFAPKMANANHLARYPLADLCLDSAPYGAHTTASDALWMGVPVLTLAGRAFASRVCGSLVTSAGLPELVCDHPRQFVEMAVALANDRPGLKVLRERLIAGRSTCVLFDTPLLVSSLEALYAEMAADHQAGRLPRPDLTNLEGYLEVGAGFDHDAEEMLGSPDYESRYREALAQRHRIWPLLPDSRLWTEEEIARAEGPAREGASVSRLPTPRRRGRAG